MKKLSPFMLVRSPHLKRRDDRKVQRPITAGLAGDEAYARSALESDDVVELLELAQGTVAKRFVVDKPISVIEVGTLADAGSARWRLPDHGAIVEADKSQVVSSREKRTIKVFEGPKRIGVLDLGAWIGALPNLLTRLNKSQSMFEIFEINAPIPAGLTKSSSGAVAWIEAQTGERLPRIERRAMGRQIVDSAFFDAALDIRKSLKLDIIVGMTPALVAGATDAEVYWNHFSSVTRRCVVLSTDDLREFARKAHRPFEAAIGCLLVAAILVACNPKLHYHDNRTCIFDYNKSRESLVGTIKRLTIDADCLELLRDDERVAALAMLGTLKTMKRTR